MISKEIYKAGIYCRLSSDDGNQGDSTSIQTQKSMLEKYCKEQGFIIYDHYVDDGYSGLNFNRPSFIRLLTDIESGKINLVITKDLSRLGRDYIQTGYYIEVYFQSKGVRYIALNDSIDTDKENNDIAPFKNILNDMFAKDLSKKIKSAKNQKAYNGMFISSQTAFGYMKDPLNHNHLVIDEEVADIIRDIYKMALLGKGTVTIAKILTQNKVITPAAYKAKKGDTKFQRFFSLRGEGWEYNWCQATVLKILKDIVYVGDMENHKYEVQNYKTKKRVRIPEEHHIIVQNTHEAIISRTDFDRVQELLSAKRRVRKNNHENIFKSIIYCKICNYRLHLAKKKYTFVYRCAHHFINKTDCPKNNYIDYESLKQIVTEKLREFSKMINTDDLLTALEKELNKNNEQDTHKNKLEKLEKRLDVLIKLTSKVYQDNIGGKINDTACDRLINEYQTEQKEVEGKIKEIKGELENEKDTINNFSKLKNKVIEYLEFKNLTQEMVNTLISKIIVEPRKCENDKITQEVTIVYRFIEMSL